MRPTVSWGALGSVTTSDNTLRRPPIYGCLRNTASLRARFSGYPWSYLLVFGAIMRNEINGQSGDSASGLGSLQFDYEALPFPVRTAQAYMRAAGWAADKSAAVAHLSPSIIYSLSASNTPSEFVASVIDRAKSGECLAPSRIRRELKAFRAKDRREFDGTARPAQNTSLDDSRLEGVAAQPMAGTGVMDLVALLARELSAEDFSRVREIMTSNAVLSDPRLAETLKRAFSTKGPLVEASRELRLRDARGRRGNCEVRSA